MAREIQDAMEGLRDVLRPLGIRFYPYEIEPMQHPAMVYQAIDINHQLTVDGQSYEATLTTRLYVAKAVTEQAMEALWDFVNPLGEYSIHAAMLADQSWNGKVDTSILRQVTNVGIQTLESGARYVAGDFTIYFIG